MTAKLNQILEALRLNNASTGELPPNVKAVVPKSRAAFPLGFGHSTRYVTTGVAIIGLVKFWFRRRGKVEPKASSCSKITFWKFSFLESGVFYLKTKFQEYFLPLKFWENFFVFRKFIQNEVPKIFPASKVSKLFAEFTFRKFFWLETRFRKMTLFYNIHQNKSEKA